MDGREVCFVSKLANTGSGKSLCYAISPSIYIRLHFTQSEIITTPWYQFVMYQDCGSCVVFVRASKNANEALPLLARSHIFNKRHD